MLPAQKDCSPSGARPPAGPPALPRLLQILVDEPASKRKRREEAEEEEEEGEGQRAAAPGDPAWRGPLGLPGMAGSNWAAGRAHRYCINTRVLLLAPAGCLPAACRPPRPQAGAAGPPPLPPSR